MCYEQWQDDYYLSTTNQFLYRKKQKYKIE